MRLFAALLTACLLIAPVSAQNGPRVPSDFAPRGSGDDGVAGERVEALELRIAQLEQLLEAQRTLQNRNRLAETRDLQQRLELLETRLLSTQDAFAAPVSAAASEAAGTAADRVQFNQLGEMLRLLQAQTDRIMIDVQKLTQRVDKASSDNEFRFQSLEGGIIRANQGISSSSAEPEVIGFVRSAVPVASLADASAVIDVTTPLVGEGNIDDLADFDAPVRVPLDDPQALYERALGDLAIIPAHGLILPRWLNVFRRIKWPVTRNIGSVRPFMCSANINRRRKPFWPVTQPMRAAKKPLTAC